MSHQEYRGPQIAITLNPLTGACPSRVTDFILDKLLAERNDYFDVFFLIVIVCWYHLNHVIQFFPRLILDATLVSLSLS